MYFHVEPQNTRSSKKYPLVTLDRDNWDDYGYKTTFHVSLYRTSKQKISLGTIKVLHREQQGGYTPMPQGMFTSLTDDHASLGSGLEYYEELYKLGPDIFRPYFEGIRDVVFDDHIKAEFEDTEGYRVSLLRFSGAERAIVDAAKLLKAAQARPKRRKSGFKVKFKTKVGSSSNSFTIDFDFRRHRRLPNRINALIGYNGTGKTKLLSNLAIVASGYGYTSKEELLDDAAGRFVGTHPRFKTVVVVSYSPFDTFVIPGNTDQEKELIQERGEIFGYVYCGLRERSDAESDYDEPSYRLRTPNELEREFLDALQRVRKAEREDAFLDVLKPLLHDASFQRIGVTQLYANRDNKELKKLFRSLSSGHKIVLKILTELTAHIAKSEPTLVLIDEPETHLHPPLLAAFLKSVRTCLEAFDGYAVIATHSPVVLQETPSKYVHVLRRIVDQNQVASTSVETFAESIGVITQEVFNLDDGSTDWHDTLRTLARIYTVEQIDEAFGRRLGFAARSYMMSLTDRVDV